MSFLIGSFSKQKPIHEIGFYFGAGRGSRTLISTLEGSHNSRYTMPAYGTRVRERRTYTPQSTNLSIEVAKPPEARRAKGGRAGGG